MLEGGAHRSSGNEEKMLDEEKTFDDKAAGTTLEEAKSRFPRLMMKGALTSFL